MATKKQSHDEEKRWKAWGERFGKRMESFGKRMEKKFGKGDGCCCGGECMAEKKKGEWYHPLEENAGKGWGWGWIFWPFGLIGPVIGAVIGIIILILSLWALKAVNVAIQSEFITLMIAAVAANIWVFFLFSLAMGYIDYLIKRSPLAFFTLYPVSNAAGITFAAWILAWVFRTIGAFSGVDVLVWAGTLARANLAWIFVIFLILGYLSFAVARKWRQ
ncbi:Uncharacterised protein [uncultured archaeon]|nr:Uncharacterised protein [uncultured archaeon]